MSKIGYVKKINNDKYFLRLSFGFDEFGKRIPPSRTVEAKSDRDAEKKLLAFYNEREKILQSRAIKVPNTLGELHEEWNERHVKASLRDSTIEFYRILWDTHLKPFENAKLKSFSPKMVSKLLKAEDIKKSPRTCKGAYRMLSAMFNWAKTQSYMLNNPCDCVDVPKYKSKKKKVYTQDEIKYIIDIINIMV